MLLEFAEVEKEDSDSKNSCNGLEEAEKLEARITIIHSLVDHSADRTMLPRRGDTMYSSWLLIAMPLAGLICFACLICKTGNTHAR